MKYKNSKYIPNMGNSGIRAPLKTRFEIAGLYNWYQLPLALASKEKFFTRQQKNVTCQVNKDTNSYYTTPICIYSWIIINGLNETEDA